MKIIDENFFRIEEFPEEKAKVLIAILYNGGMYTVNCIMYVDQDYVYEFSSSESFSTHAEAKRELLSLNSGWFLAAIESERTRGDIKKRRSIEAKPEIDRYFDQRQLKEDELKLLEAEKVQNRKEKKHQDYLRRKQRLINGEDTNPNNRGPKDRIMDF
jgi:hypothetical protein